MPDQAPFEMPPGYSAALTEIYFHRVGAAWEAYELDRVFEYVSMPKGARELLAQIRFRLAGSAQGHVVQMYRGKSDVSKERLTSLSGGSTLTRAQWEAQASARLARDEEAKL